MYFPTITDLNWQPWFIPFFLVLL